MRECTGSSLNDVMVGYDQAVAERAREPTNEEAAQQKFDQLRDGVIQPVMMAFGEVLEAHGHHCRIYDKPISVTTPGNLTQNAEIIITSCRRKALFRQRRARATNYPSCWRRSMESSWCG